MPAKPEDLPQGGATTITAPKSVGNSLTTTVANMARAADYLALRNDAIMAIHPEHAGRFNLEQVCDLYDHISDGWSYVSDPKNYNYIEKATVTWALKKGDCDDFAVAIGAAVTAIGGDVALTAAIGPDGGHAYAEVAVPKSELPAVRDAIRGRYCQGRCKIFVREHGGKVFLNLDYSAPRPGGPYFPDQEGAIVYLVTGKTISY